MIERIVLDDGSSLKTVRQRYIPRYKTVLLLRYDKSFAFDVALIDWRRAFERHVATRFKIPAVPVMLLQERCSLAQVLGSLAQSLEIEQN